MNRRERILATIVGGLAVLMGLQYGIGNYRSAVQTRRAQLASLQDTLSDKRHVQMLGAMAGATMAEYRQRSLPNDDQRIRSRYSDELLRLVNEAELEEPSATYHRSADMGKLYRQYTFQVGGKGDLRQVVRLLHGFHRRDYLQRIGNLSITPTGRGGELKIALQIEAIALHDAAADQWPTQAVATRAQQPVEAFLETITERNMLAPPNQPPRYAGAERQRAEVGKEFAFVAEFRDPDEGQSLRYALAGELPLKATIDPQTGRIQMAPEQTGAVEVTVRATDDGLPARTAEQRLVIDVVEPPPPSEPEPEFDHAGQAMLTGLVRSGGRWSAWIKVNTTGELLRLNVGDEIDVGSVQGTLVEVTDRHAVVESGDARWTIRPRQSLADAAKGSAES